MSAKSRQNMVGLITMLQMSVAAIIIKSFCVF